MAYCFLNIFVNPRLGKRRCKGIWPPSKPGLMFPPERLFWPFDPRPAVLPRPEPGPRPSRLRDLRAPFGGDSLLISIVDLLNFQ